MAKRNTVKTNVLNLCINSVPRHSWSRSCINKNIDDLNRVVEAFTVNQILSFITSVMGIVDVRHEANQTSTKTSSKQKITNFDTRSLAY